MPTPRPFLSPVLIVAVTVALAGGALTVARRPAPVAEAMTSISPAPAPDGGGPLADACSRRVGCLLR